MRSSGLKKKPSGGKTDSSVSGSGSVSGEASGLRRSTRSQNNSSVGSVRKSHRLEKRGSEMETTSPLRRSMRENKFQSSSSGKGSQSMNKGGGSRNPGGSRKEKILKEVDEEEKCEVGDKTLKESGQVKENKGSSPTVGEKRKKRLDARHFKAMFKLSKSDVSEAESKKRRMENCDGNGESGVRDPSEGTSENFEKGVGNPDKGLQENLVENSDRGIEEPEEDPQECSDGEDMEEIPEICEKGVDSGLMKSEEGLQVKCNELGDSGLGNLDKGLQENCDEDTDRGIEEPEEEPQERSDGEEMEEDCPANTDGGTEGQDYVKKNFCAEKHCDLEDGEGQLVSGGPILLPHTLETLSEKNSVNVVVGEVDGCVKEKLLNQEIPSGSDRSSDNGNGSVCSQKELVTGASVDGGEGTHTIMKTIPSGSPVPKMSSLTEDCAKCSKHSRSGHDSPMHELCCCLTNSISSANFVSVSKDGGKCSDAANEDGRKTNKRDPPVDADQGSCVTCKRVGNLLRCSGTACRRSHHHSCLWTHEENAHILISYCPECMKKRLALGVHSVSDGIESIFDAREVELSNSEGSLKEKQYFVKYKGLAHIHNCWISETRLHHEAPELLLKLSEQPLQDKSWKPEWAVPHRLLLRRSITADIQDADFASKSCHEWLVKWCDLDYDQATWELEDSEFFKKPETQQLLKEYETRHSGARSSYQQLLKEYETRHNESKNLSISGDKKIQERKKNLHVKHGRLSDSLRFESVNKLREFHLKQHNVLLLDEQDRAMKIIYFISSILISVRQPFLIIAPRESLSYWEAEFSRFTSSINVVVYGGNKDSRKIIRSLEFYREGGEPMLQVLLSSVEAISEDLEEIKNIDWEAVIIDDCQEHCILGNSGCIKTFVTNWKLLLFNAQLKDTIDEYVNILSLLEPVGSSNQYQGLMDASNKDINVLKERACSFIIAPRFQEYWVPVEISNVQLEQYCSFILSNSSVLCLSSKSDRMGYLHDILISTQKCCDHPYLVNPLLRKILLPEQPPQDAALDMGVRASGKLQLLDELLSEFKNQGLKVLILFQPIGGSGKDNLDIILDDFLTWRFGENSYEHVATGTQPSTKKAALNKFNRERDRSFLLLETRACLSSIKLSSVDSVIILNSDWNPLNDLRALQKIMIDSKLKPINVFRFYCSCTVEEKALIIAKNDTIPENTQQISASIKQNLLMWGSSYLFSRLDEFHRDKVLDYRTKIDFGSSFVTDVYQEIVSLNRNHGNINLCKYVSLARQDGRCYFTTIPLLGEQRTQLEEGVSSHIFWTKLLEGKRPQWKYLSPSSERNRKRVHYSNELSLPRNVPTVEPAKKRKDSSPRQVGPSPEKTEGHPDIRIVQQDDRKDLHEQRGLFDILKPTILTLCETLMVKVEVQKLAEGFLEFVLNNHVLTRKPETILQAFQISVCWIASEVLEKKIDHRRSLNIARDKMNFKCLEQEADSVYSKMKQLMKIFLSQNLKILKSSSDPTSATVDSTRVLNENCVNISVGSLDKITAGPDKSSFAGDGFNKENLSQLQMTNNEKDRLGNADKLKKKCEKKIKRLQEKQKNELVDFENLWEKKRVELEDTYKLESAVIRYSHANSTALVDKLKILDNDYVKKRKDLESEFSDLRKKLEARQQEERDEEQKKVEQLLTLVKPMVQDELSEKTPCVNSMQLQSTEDIGLCKDTNVILPIIENLTEDHNFGHSEMNSAVSLENVSVFQGAGVVNLAGELAEVTNPMDAVLVDKPAASESDRSNRVSTEQPQSPIVTFMEHQTADETSCQGLRDSQQRVEGVEERARPLTEIGDTSGSLLDPANPVPADLPHGDGTSVVPVPELTFPMPAGFYHTRVASSGQLNNQPNEVQVSVQNPGTQLVPQSAVAPAVDANTGQGLTYVSTTSGASVARANHPNPAPATISRGSSSYHLDPLLIEYDRIRREIGEIKNAHEETKLRLRSECDKEIKELVAQIQRKYDAKLEEAESSFSLKNNELVMHQNMVMMNKFLADALRLKCNDYKTAPQGGARKDTSSSRPFSAAGSSSAVPDSTPPPLRCVHPMLSSSGGSQLAALHVQHIRAPSGTSFPNMQSSSVLSHQPSSQPPACQSSHGQSNQAVNLILSAEELLMDIARQNDTNFHRPSDNLPVLPDNSQNHESWDVPLFGGAVPSAEVVCLSDDDD